MSDSVRPHRRQPTRLPCPWHSPGNNTGVDCHFPLQCVKMKSEWEVAQSCPTPSMDCSPPGSSIHGILQARVLEWGATAFSIKGVCRCVDLFLGFLLIGLNFISLDFFFKMRKLQILFSLKQIIWVRFSIRRKCFDILVMSLH